MSWEEEEEEEDDTSKMHAEKFLQQILRVQCVSDDTRILKFPMNGIVGRVQRQPQK